MGELGEVPFDQSFLHILVEVGGAEIARDDFQA